MTDTDKQQEQAQEPEQPPAEKPVDWEAKYRDAMEHSRGWERKAKANKGAAEELEKLKASQMSDLERAQKEADDARAKLAELEAQLERAEAVSRVAASTGVPRELLECDLSTEDGMAEFAKLYAANQARPSAPAVESPGSFARDTGAASGPEADFSSFMKANFR